MVYLTYTRIAIGLLILALLTVLVSKFWHPEFETTIVEPCRAITVGDLMYYNGENISRMLFMLSGYYIACISESVFPKSSALMHVRYLTLLISGLSFIRTIFEFFTYNTFGLWERRFDGIVFLVYLFLVIKWYYRHRR